MPAREKRSAWVTLRKCRQLKFGNVKIQRKRLLTQVKLVILINDQCPYA